VLEIVSRCADIVRTRLADGLETVLLQRERVTAEAEGILDAPSFCRVLT
jgi:hypothetical protein